MYTEGTYMIFKANCIRNEAGDGDFTFHNKFQPLNKYYHAEFFDERHPALQFIDCIVTDRPFKVRNYFKNFAAEEVVLVISKKNGYDYQIEITWFDKNSQANNSNDRYVTEYFDELNDPDDPDEERFPQDQIDKIAGKLIDFFEDYVESKKQRRLNVSYLTRQYLISV